MKKLSFLLVCVLLCLGSLAAHAQDIYLKVYPYKEIRRIADFPTSGQSLTDGLGQGNEAVDNGKRIQLSNYIQLTSFQYDLEQTLNIGSQSTGAGAGKITFNPITITKIIDALSPVLMEYSAKGIPVTLEFIFVASGGAGERVVRHKVLVGLAAVKTIAVSTAGDCGGGCANIAESVGFEYGQLAIQTYIQRPNGEIILGPKSGWDRTRNVELQ